MSDYRIRWDRVAAINVWLLLTVAYIHQVISADPLYRGVVVVFGAIIVLGPLFVVSMLSGDEQQ